ncbi:hypothetical protein FGO68_gene5808 [Halteria grandinella]|uniref:Uncharacterized protein n=1 Tax=Halteria grandinella TaxID=5974 RepID=A0A8J8NID0_HALGN|nr:hypothetical protein FGO68_gene5808 [Halteria grandinella]
MPPPLGFVRQWLNLLKIGLNYVPFSEVQLNKVFESIEQHVLSSSRHEVSQGRVESIELNKIFCMISLPQFGTNILRFEPTLLLTFAFNGHPLLLLQGLHPNGLKMLHLNYIT